MSKSKTKCHISWSDVCVWPPGGCIKPATRAFAQGNILGKCLCKSHQQTLKKLFDSFQEGNALERCVNSRSIVAVSISEHFKGTTEYANFWQNVLRKYGQVSSNRTNGFIFFDGLMVTTLAGPLAPFLRFRESDVSELPRLGGVH